MCFPWDDQIFVSTSTVQSHWKLFQKWKLSFQACSLWQAKKRKDGALECAFQLYDHSEIINWSQERLVHEHWAKFISTTQPTAGKNLRMQPGKTKIHSRPLQTYRTYPQDATLEQGRADRKSSQSQNAQLSMQVREPRMAYSRTERRDKPQKNSSELRGQWEIFLNCCLVRKIQFSSLSLRSANEKSLLSTFLRAGKTVERTRLSFRWFFLTGSNRRTDCL